jgi:hypothetical protein
LENIIRVLDNLYPSGVTRHKRRTPLKKREGRKGNMSSALDPFAFVINHPAFPQSLLFFFKFLLVKVLLHSENGDEKKKERKVKEKS